jgi:hypothetical protein
MGGDGSRYAVCYLPFVVLLCNRAMVGGLSGSLRFLGMATIGCISLLSFYSGAQ